MSIRESAEADMRFSLARALTKGKSAFSIARSPQSAPDQTRTVSSVKLGPAHSWLRDRPETPFEVGHWPLPGLAPMTRVRTSFGDVHAIALRKGDEVLTRSGAFQPILWLKRIMLDEHILRLKPDSNPIAIAPGALGAQVPRCEIMVSPRQIVVADDKPGLDGLREAATLVSRPGVRRHQETGLSYTMFHVGEAADVYCEGLFLRFPLEP